MSQQTDIPHAGEGRCLRNKEKYQGHEDLLKKEKRKNISGRDNPFVQSSRDPKEICPNLWHLKFCHFKGGVSLP